DRRRYRRRYLMECLFHRLGRYRAVATRYEKTACSSLGLAHLVSAFDSLSRRRRVIADEQPATMCTELGRLT
ncbi:MAG: hypothetical protein K0V04_45440, partial [Deltaproteobacteria bacterium]|nr:hypothetical protein [Deltaproteobacteria bacterium]